MNNDYQRAKDGYGEPQPERKKPQFVARGGLPYKNKDGQIAYENRNLGSVYLNDKGSLTLRLDAITILGIAQGIIARGDKPQINIFLNNYEEPER